MKRGDPSSLLSNGETSGVLCPVLHFPVQETWTYWIEFSEWKTAEGLEHLSCSKRLKELRLFSLEKVGQNRLNIYKHLMRYNDGRDSLPSGAQRQDQSSGNKLKNGSFPLNIRKVLL